MSKMTVSRDELHKEMFNYERKAEKIISDKEEVNKIVAKAKKIVNKAKENKYISKVIDDVFLMVDLIKDYISGEYRKLPMKTMVTVLAVILYLVSPIDLIPDFLQPVGFFDDVALIGFVLSAIEGDLKKYKLFCDRKCICILTDMITREIKELIGEKILVAAFLTEDNNVRWLLSEYEQYEKPILCSIAMTKVPLDILKEKRTDNINNIIEIYNGVINHSDIKRLNWYKPNFQLEYDFENNENDFIFEEK